MPSTIRIALATGVALVALTASASAQFTERTIRVSNGINQDHPVGNGLAKMNQCVGERSGGKMKLQGFWGGALGGDLQATQALRSGTQEMVITSTSPLVGILPPLGVFDLPFLFSSNEEADRVLDGPFGKAMSDKLPSVGLVNLAYWENGFRNLTNSRRPVEKVEDFSGVKVRVMQNNIFLDTFKTMGANAVPMAFGEVFTALETKAIDGQENPIATIENTKMHEVQKYLTLTRHAYTPFLVLYSKQLWDKLSADEQKALSECAVVGRDEERRVLREQEKTSLENLGKLGMKVSEISPADIAKMREATASVYERHRAAIGEDIMKQLDVALAGVRKK
jgi:TRAP-type transport system periplasmic protein